MKLPFIDWIWRVRGSVPVDPSDSASDAFGKLDDLLKEKNTTYSMSGDTLAFTKGPQHPQDKMSIFDGGSWTVSNGVLRYDMTSRALLACFLAPLFFLTVGHIGVAVDTWRNPPEVVKAKEEAAKKRSKVKPEDVPMSTIDKMLGAPEPEKPKAEKGGKKGEEIGKRNRKPSMTTAYVFMSIFFALWVLGRILEHWLIHTRIRKRLSGEYQASEQNFGTDIRSASTGSLEVGHAGA